MATRRGFWSLLEELGPRHPARGQLDWTASLDALQAGLETLGFTRPASEIECALENGAKWNPGFPWHIEKLSEGRYRFRATPEVLSELQFGPVRTVKVTVG